MSVHMQQLPNGNLNHIFRIYTGVPDDAPAFRHRLDYNGLCVSTTKPGSSTAWIAALHGNGVETKDLYDIAEELYQKEGMTRIRYERAEGYIVQLTRKGKRRWKKRVIRNRNVRVLAVNFSGCSD